MATVAIMARALIAVVLGIAPGMARLHAQPTPDDAERTRSVKVRANAASAPAARPLSAAECVATGFDPARSAALFVGIRRFRQDDGVAEVPYAADDAVDLAHLFVRELGLVSASRVTLALSGEPQKPVTQERLAALERAGARRAGASYTSLLREIRAAARRAEKKGMLIMTFATHGYTAAGVYRLLAQDSLVAELEDTGIQVEKLKDLAATARAPRRLVLIDACRERVHRARAGIGADRRAALPPRLASTLGDARGLAVLVASTAGGFSYDDPRKQNGVFTAAVLAGLRGAAPHDPRGFITTGTLAAFVDREVKAWIEGNRPGDPGAGRGITYTAEDLDSMRIPLLARPAAVEAEGRQSARLVESLRRLPAARFASPDFLEAYGLPPTDGAGEGVRAADAREMAAALARSGERDAEGLRAHLTTLERVGAEYLTVLGRWWRREGRRRYAALEVELGVWRGAVELERDAAGVRRLPRRALRPPVFRPGERFTVGVKLNAPCYCTVITVDAGGKGTLLLSRKVAAGYEDGFVMEAAPPGSRYLLIATRRPLRVEGERTGFAPLPKGLETPVALEDGPRPRWMALAAFLERIDPRRGAFTELRVETRTRPGGVK